MSLKLTPGRESRTSGAPGQSLPHHEDSIRQMMAFLKSQDYEGMLYGGDMDAIRQEAIRLAAKDSEDRQAARQAARSAARGVSPEGLPADEYGNVSGRTVRDANMSPADQEASLLQYQDLTDAEIRDLREGRFHGAAAQARQYEQDYGLPTQRSKTGKTSLDYLREQQNRQGFLRTGRGEMIPVGPAPTPEDLEELRVWDEWANETPGSERQAQYAPADYAKWDEARSEDIRKRAREDIATYGGNDPSKWTDEQKAARAERVASENRVADSDTQRELKIARLAEKAGVSNEEARAMMDKGRQASLKGRKDGLADAPLTAAERRLESQALRDKANTRQRQLRADDLASRQEALRSQRMLLAPGGRGVVNAINELPDGWRQIAILDRITGGRVNGPTPLGVDAVGAQNAMRFVNAEAMAGQDPAVRGMRDVQRAGAEAGLDLPIRADRERRANGGVLPAHSPAGQAVLEKIATDVIGGTYTTNWEFKRAVDLAVAQGIPRPDAEAYYRRHAEGTNSGFWGGLLGAGPAAPLAQPAAGQPSPPAVAVPAPPPGGPMMWPPVE